MMFKFPNGRPDSETMREIADSANVSWDHTPIRYEGNAIGYANGDPADEDAIKDAAESLLGVRPQYYDPE